MKRGYILFFLLSGNVNDLVKQYINNENKNVQKVYIIPKESAMNI